MIDSWREKLAGDEIVGGRFARALILDDFVVQLLALIQAIEPRALDGGDVDEHICPAFVGLNEAIAFLAVEPLYGASCHDARSLVQSAVGSPGPD